MKATIRLEQTDQVEATLTVTMPVKKWKELRAQLAKEYPSWWFGVHIRHLIEQAEQTTFYDGPRESLA